MRHLPTIEALTALDDARLVAELEVCAVLTQLARVRALVDRADRLFSTVLTPGASPARLDPEDAALAERLLEIVRSSSNAKIGGACLDGLPT